jgi:hypothetical protein
LELALFKTPWYKETVRRMRTNWIGILLLVALMVDLKSKKEEVEWANIVKDKGCHDQ